MPDKWDWLEDTEADYRQSWDWLDDNAAPLETDRQLERPKVFSRTVARRELINGLKKQALNDLIPELPAPDVEVFILTTGSGGTYRLNDTAEHVFEFGHFIPVLAERLGGQCDLYASTWTMNRAHGEQLLACLDDGRLRSVVLFTDGYWRTREAAVANAVIGGLLARGQRYLAFKNHVKCIAMRSADGQRCVSVLSSCNFSSQPRAENISLNTSPDVFHWLKTEFFEAMLNEKKG